MAVRLRPRNSEELIADADFADCVELQPEVKWEQHYTNKYHLPYHYYNLNGVIQNLKIYFSLKG